MVTVKELRDFLSDKPEAALVVLEEKYEPLTNLAPDDYDDYVGLATGNPKQIYTMRYSQGMVWLMD
jgi:hypothetical protein